MSGVLRHPLDHGSRRGAFRRLACCLALCCAWVAGPHPVALASEPPRAVAADPSLAPDPAAASNTSVAEQDVNAIADSDELATNTPESVDDLEARGRELANAGAHEGSVRAYAEAYAQVRPQADRSDKLVELAGLLARASLDAYKGTGDREYLTYGLAILDDCEAAIAERPANEALAGGLGRLAVYREWLVGVGNVAVRQAPPEVPKTPREVPETPPERPETPPNNPPPSTLPTGGGLIAGGIAMAVPGAVLGWGAVQYVESDPGPGIAGTVGALLLVGGGIAMFVVGIRRAKYRNAVIRSRRSTMVAPSIIPGGGGLVWTGRF